MKNIFSLICFCFSTLIFSQGITFTTEIQSSLSEQVYQVIEDDDGNYVYAGKIHSSLGTDNGKIIKLNAYGEIIDSLYIPSDNPPSFLIPSDIIQVGNHYYCIASETGKLLFIKLDKNLNIIIQKELPLLSYGGNSYIDISYLMCNSNNHLIISGGIDSLVNYKKQPYLYEVSLNGDSIHAIYPQPTYGYSSFTEVIEQPNNVGYMAFGKGFSNTGIISTMMLYDTSFNLLRTDTLDLHSRWEVSAIQIEDTIVAAVRTSAIDSTTPLLYNFYGLLLLKITTNNDSLNHKVIEGGKQGEATIPAALDAIDTYNHNLFVTGTIRYEDDNVFPYSGLATALAVTKTDLDLNIIWKRKIQADSVKYNVFGIIATKDGGCLVYGTRYDMMANDYQRNTFVIKLDELGNISFVKEDAHTPILLTVYPNPTKDFIRYKVAQEIEVENIELINIAGQKVKGFLNPPSLLNVQDVKQGLYVMRFFTNKGVVTKKVVLEH